MSEDKITSPVDMLQPFACDLEPEPRSTMSTTPETTKPKIAPVQGYAPGIPWLMHIRAYEAYCAKCGPQCALIDLEGRNCRGGFHTSELDQFIPGWREELEKQAIARAGSGEPLQNMQPLAGSGEHSDQGGSEAWWKTKVTVCDKCFQATCWAGKFMCDEAQTTAGIAEKTVLELIRLNTGEHPDHWGLNLVAAPSSTDEAAQN